MMNKPGLDYAAAGVDYGTLDASKILAQKAARATAVESGAARRRRDRSVARRVGVSRRGRRPADRVDHRVPRHEGARRRRRARVLGPQPLRHDRARHDRDGRQRSRHRRRDAAVDARVLVGRQQRVVRRPASACRISCAAGKAACDVCGMAWGGGETPALGGVVEADRIDLAASCVGIVKAAIG